MTSTYWTTYVTATSTTATTTVGAISYVFVDTSSITSLVTATQTIFASTTYLTSSVTWTETSTFSTSTTSTLTLTSTVITFYNTTRAFLTTIATTVPLTVPTYLTSATSTVLVFGQPSFTDMGLLGSVAVLSTVVTLVVLFRRRLWKPRPVEEMPETVSTLTESSGPLATENDEDSRLQRLRKDLEGGTESEKES
jgi:hypothetical protein